MKKAISLILTVITFQSSFAQRFDWATTGGAAGIANSFNGAIDIARDPQGNIYTMDFSNHAQQCQGDTLQPIQGGVSTYIYKFNAQGELLFMNRVGPVSGTFNAFNIETDDAGSLYLLGQPNGVGTIVVNEDTVPTVASTNQLIKMDSLGNFVWIKNTSAATNGDGCMLQYSNGYLYYQSGNLSVSKIDTAGVVDANLTASYYSSPTASSGLLFKGSAVFPNGDLLFAAYSRGTVAYGTDTLFHIGNPFLTAPFLFVRCDTNMNLIWAKYASNGRDPDNNFIPVAIDSSDNVYAAVQVNLEMIIGNDTIQSTDFTGQGTIIKFDGNGTGIWAKALQSSGLAYAWCMQNTPDNSGILIGGGYTGTAQFGSFALTGSSQNLPFIAKFDLNGNYTNAFSYAQDPTQTDAKCMSADGNGNYYVGGKLANSTVPIFSCTPAPANRGFYLASFTEQPDIAPTPTIIVNGNQLTASPEFSGDIQWYFNGNILNNENGQTLLATETGNYSVTYAYITGCISADTSSVLNVVVTSISDNYRNSPISIYPNPSTGLFQITGIKDESSSYDVSVCNLLGATIYNFSNINKNQAINIGDAAPGIYLVQVKSNNTNVTFKILKQ
jgi:hypothetical protein